MNLLLDYHTSFGPHENRETLSKVAAEIKIRERLIFKRGSVSELQIKIQTEV